VVGVFDVTQHSIVNGRKRKIDMRPYDVLDIDGKVPFSVAMESVIQNSVQT
jgi:hypothetical protein